jgi:signal transduction histidine kinase
MTEEHKPHDPISTKEFNNTRQNLQLLAMQVRNGRVDGDFLTQQVHKLEDFFERLEVERQQARQGQRFEALYNISRILGSSLALQTVLDQVMDAVLQLTRAERGFIMLRDHDGGVEVVAARNLDQQTLDNSQFHYSRTVTNYVLDAREPVVTTNAPEDPRFSGLDSIMAQSLRSIMAIPLHARGDVIGVVYVDSRVTTDLFEQADLDAMQALAGQAAIAIENARLFEQTDKQLAETVKQLTQLRRIDRQLNESLDPDHAMQITLEWAVRLTKAQCGYLGLLDADAPDAPFINVKVEGETSLQAVDMLHPSVHATVREKRPLADVTPVADKEEAVMILPIMRENKVFGVVVLIREAQNPFTTEETDLAGRVINRAAVTIENARLYTAVKAADRAKSEFVGVVAHDLKVPMNSIMGYSNLTQMIGKDHNNLVGRQNEFLTKIQDTVRYMERMVSDLADISRIEGGHFSLDQVRVDVQKITEAVQDTTILQINERNHTFTLKVEPNLPKLYVDYYRLLQVLTNLVSNAYKYTPDGGNIDLIVMRDGDRVRFTVQDTGIGLSPDQVANLGRKFWRAEDEYTRNQPGAGLGFAITISLVRLMGSRIDIKSAVGQGSSFSFTVATADDNTN